MNLIKLIFLEITLSTSKIISPSQTILLTLYTDEGSGSKIVYSPIPWRDEKLIPTGTTIF
jgi:hypothetical protein